MSSGSGGTRVSVVSGATDDRVMRWYTFASFDASCRGTAHPQDKPGKRRTKVVKSSYKYRGDLAETTLPEMLYTIDRFQVPGLVEARQGRVIKRVYLRAGYVIHASSTDRADSLGAHLLKRKSVRSEILEELASERRHSNKRLGVMLLERGLLSPAQVFRAIREQIEAIVWSLFYWEEGEITFGVGELKAGEMVQIQLPIRQCIIHGIRQAPDAKLMVARLGQKDTILEPCFDAEDLVETGLDVGDFKLLRSVDGKRSLYDLCSQGPKPAAEIAKMLYAFQILHLICPQGQTKTQAKKSSRHGPVKIKLGSGDRK